MIFSRGSGKEGRLWAFKWSKIEIYDSIAFYCTHWAVLGRCYQLELEWEHNHWNKREYCLQSSRGSANVILKLPANIISKFPLFNFPIPATPTVTNDHRMHLASTGYFLTNAYETRWAEAISRFTSILGQMNSIWSRFDYIGCPLQNNQPTGNNDKLIISFGFQPATGMTRRPPCGQFS